MQRRHARRRAGRSVRARRLGLFRLRIAGPDGTQNLTVRASPDARRDARFAVERRRLSVPDDRLEDVSIVGHFCTLVEGEASPTVGDERLYYDARVDPGEHPF